MNKQTSTPSQIHRLQQTIYENLPVGMELYDGDGYLIEINSVGLKMMGVKDKQDMLGINIFENPNIPVEMKRRLRAGENIRFTVKYDFDLAKAHYPTVLSGISYFEITVSVVLDENKEIDKFLFIAQDVTEAVHTQEILRQSKQKTALAMQAAEVMLWEFDVRTRLFYAENEPLNGYDPTQALTIEDYKKQIHPEDWKKAEIILLDMLSGCDCLYEIDFRIRLSDTSEWQYCKLNCTPYERGTDGKVIKYVGFRKNNTELQRRKLLQENILNSIPLPIHIKDVEDDFRYVFCNEESMRMFGTHEGETVCSVLDSEQAERMQKTDLEVFTTGKPYFGVERIILKDGRSYDTIVRKNIIYDGTKRLLLNIRWDQKLQNDLKRRAKVLSMSMEVMNAYTWFYEPSKQRVSFGEGFDKIGRNALDINSFEKFAECVHPDDRQRFVDTMDAVLKQDSGEWDIEYRADLRGNGNYEWWKTRGVLETSILNDHPYQYVSGMSISIESYKQTELTLLKNKEKLNKLIRQNELVLNNTNSGLAYITTDYVVQWENVSVCSSSLSFEAYKRGECCYKSAHNRTSPCDNCVLSKVLVSRQMEKIKFHLENNRIVEVLATPVFNESEEIDGIVIRVDDITDRERMIEELRQAKLLAEQSDKLKSAFLANMSHEIRTPLNAIVGFSDLLMNSEEQGDKEEYMQIINTNNELLLKLINDITDRERMIEELRQAKLLAEQSDKLKSAFLANMSHEIRTPLNAIVGFSDLLMNSEEQGDKEEYMQIINTNNELLLKLINDILDLSKLESGSVELKYEEFDLAEYFDSMASSMKQRVTNPKVQLVAVNPYSVCRVRLDKNRVAQVVTNYVTNAIKYTPQGTIEMGYEVVDAGIRLYVRDTGIGIPEEKKRKVFHRFEKLDEFAQGTGLGLSICKAITESMGGSVGFESEYSRGSLFWAVLPCDPEVQMRRESNIAIGQNAGKDDLIRSGNQHSALDRKTVLVVEDISSNYLLISAMLSKHYNLLHAVNGEQAVAMVKEYKIDLLLMDMKMPVMDGLTATAEIRKFDTNIPIVALTAHAFESDKVAALKSGCNDYLVKPVDKARLMSVLRKYCHPSTLVL